MSYTNQTQHYGLPQYIGSDVPAYLTDYNTAMATIDQGMNAAKTQADAAATTAGQAANDITALNSTVQTQATQISAAAQSASSAQQTANSADDKADALDARVSALETAPAVNVTKKEYTSMAVTTAYGSIFINATPIPYSELLPAGKTVNDVIALTTIPKGAGALTTFYTAQGIHVVSPISITLNLDINVVTK